MKFNAITGNIPVQQFFTILFVLNSVSLFSKDKTTPKAMLFCHSFSQGSHWIYATRNDADTSAHSTVEITIVSNENGRVREVSKVHSQSGNSHKESTITVNYVLDKGSIFIANRTVKIGTSESTTTHVRPEPYCGAMPSEWIDSSETVTTISGKTTRQANIPVHVKNRFLGSKNITVKAGKFKVTLFERTYSYTEKDGSGTTTIKTDYVADNIGVVKTVTIMLFKTRKNIESNKSQQQKENFEVKKVTAHSELISYK